LGFELPPLHHQTFLYFFFLASFDDLFDLYLFCLVLEGFINPDFSFNIPMLILVIDVDIFIHHAYEYLLFLFVELLMDLFVLNHIVETFQLLIQSIPHLLQVSHR
jgi:hypothetical protein